VDFLLWLDVVGFPIETHAILIDVLMDFPCLACLAWDSIWLILPIQKRDMIVLCSVILPRLVVESLI
jgi:hypothetical protein